MAQRVFFQYVYLQVGSQIVLFSINLKLLKKSLAYYNTASDLYAGVSTVQSKYDKNAVHQSTKSFEEFVEYLGDVKNLTES